MNPLNVLAVDDNEQNLKVLAQMLTRQGATTTSVNNPSRLNAILPTLQLLDVVFLDLGMPGMDGYQVKDMVRLHFETVPIIAYTVHVSEINVVRQMGFDGFLAKPLDDRRFPDQLARILRGEAVWERN